LLEQLDELMAAEESDEYGMLRPTKHSFDLALQLIIDTAVEIRRAARSLPRGCVSTNSEGGIRVEWIRPAVSVHLVVPATRDHNAYIYHEAGDQYATEAASPVVLASRLSAVD